MIADTLSRHAKLRLQVVLADRRVDLLEEGFDLAVRVGPLDDSSLTAVKLGDGHVYLVASPRRLAHRRVTTAKALGDLPTIGLRPVETWSVLGDRVKLEPRLVVNDLELACEAAIAGVGVALIPSIVCREALLDGRLEALLGRKPATSLPVHAVFPSRRYLPPKVRVFLDALRTLVEPMAPIPLGGRARRSR